MAGTLEQVGPWLVTVAGQDGKPAGAVLEKESSMVVLEPSTMRCVAAVATHAGTCESPTFDMFATALSESVVHEDDKLASLGAELVG